MDTINKHYFLYTRNASGTKCLSNPSMTRPIATMTGIAKQQSITIVDVFNEVAPANKPYTRKAFNQMIERIRQGEANGILTTDLSRLSRNPVESRIIMNLLRNDVLHSIITPSDEYNALNTALFNLPCNNG